MVRRDSYGRPFLDGTEETPNDLICLRCGEVPYRQGNPFGTHIFEYGHGARRGMQGAFALCGPCSIELWAFLSPEVLSTPLYIARKDQAEASLLDCIRQWNQMALLHNKLDQILPEE